MALSHLVSGQIQQAISCILIPFVAMAYANFANSRFVTRHSFKLQIAILFLVILLSLDQWMRLNFVSVYGRNQILFGVDHPKEQALLILFVFYTFWGPFNTGKLHIPAALITLLLLFFTDARASLLGFCVFLFTYLVGLRVALSLALILFFGSSCVVSGFR